MNRTWRALITVLLSWCLFNLQITPVVQQLQSSKKSQALTLASVQLNWNSAQAQDKTDDAQKRQKMDPCDPANKGKMRDGACVQGKFEDGTGEFAYVEPYVSMVILLAAAIATMLMIKGCVLSKSCGWAALFAAVAAIALLGGEVAIVVANKKVLQEIEYSVTALKRNGAKCASGSGSESLTDQEKRSGNLGGADICEQEAALQAQKEAYDSIATGLLIKSILYYAAGASYLTAMIIELAANSVWISESEMVYASSKVAIAGCHATCAAQGPLAAQCLLRIEPCMAAVVADELSIRAIQVWNQASPGTAKSIIECQTLIGYITSICPSTAANSAACSFPTRQTCIGQSRAGLACLPAAECLPHVRLVITNFERLIDAMQCATPSAADLSAQAATGSPLTPCVVGWTTPVLGTAYNTPSNPDQELLRNLESEHSRIGFTNNNADIIKVMKELSDDKLGTMLKESISGILGGLIAVAKADDKKAEDQLSQQYPILGGIGIGLIGVGLLVGAILLAVNMQDMFFTNPKNRAIFYGFLSGAILLQASLIIGVARPSVMDQADKVQAILNRIKGNEGLKTTANGVKPITSFPTEGVDLSALDDQGFDDQKAPPLPCPNGGDGKGNCNPIGGVTETGLVNTPLSGMAGILNNVAKLNNDLAGKRGISKSALNTANELGKAVGKLKKVAALLKKQNNALENQLKMKPTDFDGANSRLGRNMYSTAKKFLDSKGATAATFGATGAAGISDKLAEKLSDEAKADLAKASAPAAAGAADPFAGMNFQEEAGATVDLGDEGAAAMNELDIKVDDITNDENGNIFELLSMRYKKTAYPVLFEEVK